ncbi:MAG: hypothetical protein ACOX8U_03945 [Bradymonadia bacterium]
MKVALILICAATMALSACTEQNSSIHENQNDCQCDEKDCPRCERCEVCETCEACQCDGKDCPRCERCEVCETCEACQCDGKDCPRCEVCETCETCRDAEIQASLDACQGNYDSCKQDKNAVTAALTEKENEANACNDALGTCQADYQALAKIPRSKSGSRLIYKTIEYPDGSIHVDPYPYDTLLERFCNPQSIRVGDETMHCCVRTDTYLYNNFGDNHYLDSSCTVSIGGDSDYRYVYIARDCVSAGDVHLDAQAAVLDACTHHTIYTPRIVEHIEDTETVYYKSGEDCLPQSWAYPLVKTRLATAAEVRNYYVCSVE